MTTDITPAPLDPALVKAGDTVTLEAPGGRRVTAPVSERTLPERTKGTWFLDVFYDDDSPQSFSAVHWTLTDHQPALEPEPEWKPGTVAEATVRGYVGVRVLRLDKPDRHPQWLSITHRDALGTTLHHARQVTDVRPLVVIDPTPVLRADIEAAGRRLVAAHAMQPRDENVDAFVAQVCDLLGIEAP